jgi:hypothetical protein
MHKRIDTSILATQFHDLLAPQSPHSIVRSKSVLHIFYPLHVLEQCSEHRAIFETLTSALPANGMVACAASPIMAMWFLV